MAYQLRVGFDQTTPEEEATKHAIGEWHESVRRHGFRALDEPVAQVVRTAERTAMGEYVIEVTGQREEVPGGDE